MGSSAGAWPQLGDVKVETLLGGKQQDMVVYSKEGSAVAVGEFKRPNKPVQTDYKNAKEKAESLGAPLFITSNFNETIVWHVSGERLKSFGPIGVSSLEEFRDAQKKIALQKLWKDVLDFVYAFTQQGLLALTNLEQSRFYIRLITRKAKELGPEFQKAFELSLIHI